LENVVEDVNEAEKDAAQERKTRLENELEQSQGQIDMNDEKDKIQFALELAIHQVDAKRRAGGGADEAGEADDLNESIVKVKTTKGTQGGKKASLGTNLLIKLPYIIGTIEYEKHPFAGVVFANTEYEQTVLFAEEQTQIDEDRKKE